MHSPLQTHFETGRLVRPSDERPNLVHLARAIASVAGATGVEASPAVAELVDAVGGRPAEHLVFVLLDGLGMSLLEKLPANCFLRRTFRRELTATCPSTTACALTSIATAEYPSRHGIVGWFARLPDRGFTAVLLPFTERVTGQGLADRGLRVEDLIALPTVHPRMARRPVTLMPRELRSSAYSTWSRGGTTALPFDSPAHAVDQAIGQLKTATAPTYVHVYVPDIDAKAHHAGATSDKVIELTLQIDRELARLAESVGRVARIVITADHGLIDVPTERQSVIVDGDPLLAMLVAPPTGDARMPIFHLRPGRRAAFLELFAERYAERFVLLEPDDVERLELLGPGTLSDVTRARLGHYVAIPTEPATITYHAPGKSVDQLYRAVHAGLSPEEMRTPLCVV